MPADNGDKPFIKVAAAFGLIAGLGALITVLGGVALTLRFWSTGVPMEAIVGGLPTRFFLSVGLDVTLQLFFFAGFVALSMLFPHTTLRPVFALLAAAVLLYPFARTATGREWIWIGALAALTAFVLYLPHWLRQDPADAAIVGVLALLAFVAWRGAFELTAGDVMDAKACLIGDQEEVGLFVGENSDSVFIGVRPASPQPGRVSEIPRSHLKRLYIGHESGEIPCPKDPPGGSGK
jgi:hypothetical protein